MKCSGVSYVLGALVSIAWLNRRKRKLGEQIVTQGYYELVAMVTVSEPLGHSYIGSVT